MTFYIALRARDLNRLPEPNPRCAISGTPRPLLVESARLIREGFGMPSMFADEVVIPSMMSLGLPSKLPAITPPWAALRWPFPDAGVTAPQA